MYVMHTKNSNSAESRHEERNKKIELLSMNARFTCNESAYAQMKRCVIRAQENTCYALGCHTTCHVKKS